MGGYRRLESCILGSEGIANERDVFGFIARTRAKELGWFWTETKSVVGADGLRCHLLLVRRLPDGKPEVWELKMQPIATKLEDAE
jgi:hypothetical protein